MFKTLTTRLPAWAIAAAALLAVGAVLIALASPAYANVCQTCNDGGVSDGGGSLPAPAPKQYKLVLALECVQQQEKGADEPYLLVDARWAWSDNDMNTGEARVIEIPVAGPKTFPDTFRVELWEDDGDHWYDRNDRFGVAEIAPQIGQNYEPKYFTDDGEVYILSYSIVEA